MGIRFTCPNGHKLHVKTFLAGKRGVCPQCGVKILIPSTDEPEQVGAIAPVEVGRVDAIVASSPGLETPMDVGSQSIIIAVAESSVESVPNVTTPVSAPTPIVAAFPPVLANGPPTIGSEVPTGVQTFVVADAIGPVSPAVRYVAQRERNRRNQFTIAVLLLLAVIVLAGVLIWVLQRGSGAAPAKKEPTSQFDSSRSRYFAVSSDRCQISYLTQVAT